MSSASEEIWDFIFLCSGWISMNFFLISFSIIYIIICLLVTMYLSFWCVRLDVNKIEWRERKKTEIESKERKEKSERKRKEERKGCVKNKMWCEKERKKERKKRKKEKKERKREEIK